MMYNGYDGVNKEETFELRLVSLLFLWFSFQTREKGLRTGDASVVPPLSKRFF